MISGGFIVNQMDKQEEFDRLKISLKKKQLEAQEAKDKGLTTAYSNLLLEINLMKTKLKKFQMGGK